VEPSDQLPSSARRRIDVVHMAVVLIAGLTAVVLLLTRHLLASHLFCFLWVEHAIYKRGRCLAPNSQGRETDFRTRNHREPAFTEARGFGSAPELTFGQNCRAERAR
jgi:hypothetical protein